MAPCASGATASAHREINCTWSGAAVAAASTMAATVCVLAFDALIAAFTTSQAQAGAAATSAETISRTFEGWAATVFLTETESAAQSMLGAAWSSPKVIPKRTEKTVFFMFLLSCGTLEKKMERAAGIEPACLTWKDSALPLSYARDFGES